MGSHKGKASLPPGQEFLTGALALESALCRALETIAAKERRTVLDQVAIFLEHAVLGASPSVNVSPAPVGLPTKGKANSLTSKAAVAPSSEASVEVSTAEYLEIEDYIAKGVLVPKGNSYVGIQHGGTKWRTMLTSEDNETKTLKAFSSLHEAALARGRDRQKNKPGDTFTADNADELEELIADRSVVKTASGFHGVYPNGKGWHAKIRDTETTPPKDSWSPTFSSPEGAALYMGRIYSRSVPEENTLDLEYDSQMVSYWGAYLEATDKANQNPSGPPWETLITMAMPVPPKKRHRERFGLASTLEVGLAPDVEIDNNEIDFDGPTKH